ncbi:uncharacterized protein LOC120254784 [Dioscorea cayenensis subsp. rotundata]|uniref:Uncharacterized protein LOC120254784 n=1 Tax=Dioscorea cayennensis subsp. rotundata TaxID=55577 RepID=A0AB40AUZ3_DIOCR|nr:uncharacterized protein LOC120254784 [Dioscorea cayenensis subsp. rotundata]
MGEKYCKSFIDIIPQELIEEIVAYIASTSSRSLHDLKILRGCCKSFYVASKSRKVGQLMRVDNLWYLDMKEYISVLQNCAQKDNLEACLVLGLIDCMKLKMDSGIQYLTNAAFKGHLLAGYVGGIILYKNQETRPSGMAMLNMVAIGRVDHGSKPFESKKSGNYIINNCRYSAAKLFRDIVWSIECKWLEKEEWECESRLCGRKIDDILCNEWLGEDGLVREFCSHVCRWKYEFNMFTTLL